MDVPFQINGCILKAVYVNIVSIFDFQNQDGLAKVDRLGTKSSRSGTEAGAAGANHNSLSWINASGQVLYSTSF